VTPYYEYMPQFESADQLFAYLRWRGETRADHDHLPVQDAWDDDRWVCEVPGCDWTPA
jgi:hypothetical protein